jgi:threonine dehydrogenase-like Zn-dependent dehydrogenase
MNRSLRIVTGQTHVHRYMQPLMDLIQQGKLDPTFIITHRLSLDDAPRGYQLFDNKLENCEKVVLKAS